MIDTKELRFAASKSVRDLALLPSEVLELLDRLEEAETAWKEADKACRDLTEKVIPNLRESHEEAEKEIALRERVIDALGSELNAVANKRDALQVEVSKLKGLEVSRCVKINGYIVDNARLAGEVEQLRAKIEQMERQEPVAKVESWTNGSYTRHYKLKWLRDVGEGAALYDRPGAQPAPSVPMDMLVNYLVSISAHIARRDDGKAQAEIGELLKMIVSAPKPEASVPEDVMRDAERYRYLRARDDGTAGVGCWIEADGRVCDRGWLYGVQLDSAIDSFIEVLAASPEAKP